MSRSIETACAPPRRSLIEEPLHRMVHWLLHSGLVRDDGGVASWLGPGDRAFVYPESTGLFVHLMAYLHRITGEASHLEAARRSGRFLLGTVHETGGVPRGRAVYAFDTAVAIRALLALHQVDPTGGWADRAMPLGDFLSRLLDERRASLPISGDLEARWSTRFGPHLLKCSGALRSLYRATGDPAYLERANRLPREIRPDLAESDTDSGGGEPIYVHSLCYALEGSLSLRAWGILNGPAPIRSLADRLSSFQSDDGGIGQWAGREGATGFETADVTAQSIRIWTLVDPEGHGHAIDRGLSHLHALQAPSGGLRYPAAW